jgi:Tol biopolymer transport system component
MESHSPPDGDYIYFVHDREGTSDTNDAYVVPALGGKPRLILQNVVHAIGFSHDGKSLAFVPTETTPNSSESSNKLTADPPVAETFMSREPFSHCDE